MLIGSVLRDPPVSVTLSGAPVKRVTTFKLLGVHVANDLKWAQHVDAISSKAASRLYFLKLLKRSGAGLDDLLCFYKTVVRPVYITCVRRGIQVSREDSRRRWRRYSEGRW